MKILFFEDDGELLDTIVLTTGSRPDEEDLEDDNLYEEERHGILDAVEDTLKYIIRHREAKQRTSIEEK